MCQPQQVAIKLNIARSPTTLKERHRNARVLIDLLWVSGSPLLCEISEVLELCVMEILLNIEKGNSSGFLSSDVDLCTKCSLTVTTINVDLEFERAKEDFPVPINIVNKSMHARPVERLNRTVKKCVRYLAQNLPFY